MRVIGSPSLELHKQWFQLVAKHGATKTVVSLGREAWRCKNSGFIVLLSQTIQKHVFHSVAKPNDTKTAVSSGRQTQLHIRKVKPGCALRTTCSQLHIKKVNVASYQEGSTRVRPPHHIFTGSHPEGQRRFTFLQVHIQKVNPEIKYDASAWDPNSVFLRPCLTPGCALRTTFQAQVWCGGRTRVPASWVHRLMGSWVHGFRVRPPHRTLCLKCGAEGAPGFCTHNAYIH